MAREPAERSAWARSVPRRGYAVAVDTDPVTLARPPHAHRHTQAVRALLGFLSVYHVVTGIVSVFFPDFSERFYQVLYHFHPTMTEQYKLVLKPWGALALCAGITGLYAARDPRRYRGVVVAIAILLALRVGYRTYYATTLLEVFRIDYARNATNSVVIALEVLLFGSWLWRTRHEETTACSPTPPS